MQRTPSRKKPCRICRRWFVPHPRQKDRQKTCGDPECQRTWHKKQCAEWNKKNPDYFKENYLQKKLDSIKTSTPKPPKTQSRALIRSRFKTGLPLLFVQEAINTQQIVIIEYLAQLLNKRFQEAVRAQVPVNT